MNYTAINKINSSNESIWQTRFGDSADIINKASKVLAKAEKIEYQRGSAYSKLNLAAVNFYQSKNGISLEYLTEAFHWFENNKLEKGYIRALLLKGNIFETFGDYEITLKLWFEAYQTSRAISDIESEGEACSQLGLIYSRLCNFQKALEYFNKGLKIREDLNDENAVASSLNRIGMVLRQTKKYDESLRYYFRSLEIRRKNKQGSAIPWTLLGIANTYEDMKKYQESLDYYEQGTTDGDNRCILQCLMGAGRVNSKLGDSKKAEERLKESLRMAQELKSLLLVADAYSSLAAHYELYKKHEKAIKSYKLYLKTKDSFHSYEVQSKLSNIEVTHAIEKSEQEKEIYRLRHVELKEAYDIIEEKNKDITSSINYACRIQNAILPNPVDIKGLNLNLFILYRPKDIISGDFYWFTESNGKLVIVAGDCTGHGVPGALMSMLGISFLEEIVNKREISDTGLILDALSKEVKRALHQKGERNEAKDGMDISICILDKKNNSVQYSGANNNLYMVSNNQLIEYKADRMPIGYNEDDVHSFSSHTINTHPGDILYMFSDGYPDQFGGPNRKKFKYSALKALFLEIHDQPLETQKKKLEKEFYKWKGNDQQTDDIMILGIRV
jgi:serine phosphatase RsbU (regulator of sigma subunit)